MTARSRRKPRLLWRRHRGLAIVVAAQQLHDAIYFRKDAVEVLDAMPEPVSRAWGNLQQKLKDAGFSR